ncbi:hypothetical protein [Psychrobacillus phage Perkons]|nr:hypothetical protein [Psychrobacillus phage Perkons]
MDSSTLIAVLCVVVGILVGYLIVDKVKGKVKNNVKSNAKKKIKPQYSKLIVMSVILLNILFTVATLFVFMKTGNEPMTLVGCWFAFTTGELWMLSSIKKTKHKKLKDDI